MREAKTQRAVTHLDNLERKQLASVLKGYGNMTAAAEKTGLTTQTLKNINRLGRGLAESIRAVRERLLASELIEPETTAAV